MFVFAFVFARLILARGAFFDSAIRSDRIRMDEDEDEDSSPPSSTSSSYSASPLCSFLLALSRTFVHSGK